MVTILYNIVFILMLIIVLKAILGFAYFDFTKWYKKGNVYLKEYDEWMKKQP